MKYLCFFFICLGLDFLVVRFVCFLVSSTDSFELESVALEVDVFIDLLFLVSFFKDFELDFFVLLVPVDFLLILGYQMYLQLMLLFFFGSCF